MSRPVVVLWCLVVTSNYEAEAGGLRDVTSQDSTIATVHIIAHSHDDPGWVETVDQYYSSEVEALLDNTIASLRANSSRIFNQVEMIYFRRWWLNQTVATQLAVKDLVSNGQLAFLNGGLCMNDEATTHNGAIIDQMTWGHQFINETFGPQALPTVAWQIDSFGHSAGYAAMISSMGLTAVVGQKVDLQDQEARAASKQLEFNWITQAAGGPQKNDAVVGHICFDNTKGYSYLLPPTFDKPGEPGYNIEEVVALFNTSVETRRPRFKHSNDLLFLYGNDFAYQDAPAPFENMEKVMRYINNRPEQFGYKVEYSTPAKYFAAIRNCTSGFGNYTGDFFPTSFSSHYIRSGYYSSRPASKNGDRTVWARGNAAQRLETLMKLKGVTYPHLTSAIAAVDAAIGVHQHHDAMSGTDYDWVAADYMQRINVASSLLGPPAAGAATSLATENLSITRGGTCDQANISVCSETMPLVHGTNVSVVLFNPLSLIRTTIVSIPVPISTAVPVDPTTDAALDFEIHEAVFHDETDPESQQWTMFVRLESLQPLESRLIRILPSGGFNLIKQLPVEEPLGEILLSTNSVNATVNSDSGYLESVLGEQVQASLMYYTPNMANSLSKGWGSPNPCSSAYAFRPKPGRASPYSISNKVTFAKGTLVQQSVAEIVIGHNKTITLVNRVLSGDSAVHTLVRIGPLDISNMQGQEAILKFKTNIKSSSHWWTDSNGLQMMKRLRRLQNTSTYNVTEPVAQNYYPATASTYIEDDSKALTLAFCSAHGVSSLADGELELMIHRRQVDHGCRVDEGYEMDDKHPVIQSVRLQIGEARKAAASYRTNSLKMLHPIEMYFGDYSVAGYSKPATTRFAPLPNNVHLHTMRLRSDELEKCDPFKIGGCFRKTVREDGYPYNSSTLANVKVIIRLQHLYETGEDSLLSLPATVEIDALFGPGTAISQIDELTLSAAETLSSGVPSKVLLHPMQIRTFLLHLV